MVSPLGLTRVFDRPVFIVAAPRSGSTLLFEILARAGEFWTIGDESHAVFETIPSLRPFVNGKDSNQLGAEQADSATSTKLIANFVALLRNRDSVVCDKLHPSQIRMLEKTPKNALRIPFLSAVFPDAMFVYIYREPRDNISSIMEAWRSGRFVTYQGIPGWDGDWSLLLPPGWQELRGQPLQRIAAFQWATANLAILDSLTRLDPARWTSISYAALLENPKSEIRRLCSFCGITFDKRLDEHLSKKLPMSKYTLTAPSSDKWRKNETEVNSVLPTVEKANQHIKDAVSSHQSSQGHATMPRPPG